MLHAGPVLRRTSKDKHRAHEMCFRQRQSKQLFFLNLHYLDTDFIKATLGKFTLLQHRGQQELGIRDMLEN